MRITGLTAEYNPIHNGHIYHLRQSRAMNKADFIVAVMSGDFTQRGEPAVFDKWTRAAWAVRSGVDLVFELPVVFAAGSAEQFADGAVRLLTSLGCVSDLSFGSECGDIGALYQLAGFLDGEPEAYRQALHEQLDRGLSYPAAREAAVRTVIGDAAADLLRRPNDILGIEYLKALRRLQRETGAEPVPREGRLHLLTERGRTVIPAAHCVPRRGAYHLREASGADLVSTAAAPVYAGGEAVRERLRQYDTAALRAAVPPPVLEDLQHGVWDEMVGTEAIWPALQSRLLLMPEEDMRRVDGVREGIEHRIRRVLRRCHSYAELVESLQSRRFPRTTVQRMLLHLLLDIRPEDVTPPSYARLLAAGARGRKLLRLIDRSGCSRIPVITNLPRQRERLDGEDGKLPRLLELDVTAADLYNQAAGRDLYARSDFVVHPRILP
ncbi:MAG: nucleotidyltransferase family protein [Anaerovoracaceae bacterium]|jgi:predicted nucleotidyltransferase